MFNFKKKQSKEWSSSRILNWLLEQSGYYPITEIQLSKDHPGSIADTYQVYSVQLELYKN